LTFVSLVSPAIFRPSSAPRAIAVALAVIGIAWAILIVIAPLQLRSEHAVLGTAVYAAGSVVCHQQPERSFHLGGVRMPVCARCTGLYIAGAAGLLAGWLGGAREPRRARALFVASLLPVALSVAVEWAGLAAPSNGVRAATGLPAGAVAGWLISRMLRSAGHVLRYHHLS